MARTRFVIEIGTGIDLDGTDPTKAAIRAIDDAIHRNCLCGIQEYAGLQDLQKVTIQAKIACPRHELIDQTCILEHFPFGNIQVLCVDGGLITEGASDPMRSRHTEIIVAVAALTVFLNGDA